MNKYKLTSTKKKVNGITLYRIEALQDFADISKGDKGGYVQSEKNLSQEGRCWLYDDACAYGDAVVSENATLHDEACACGNSTIKGYCRVHDEAVICGNAFLAGPTYVSGSVKLEKGAYIGENIS